MTDSPSALSPSGAGDASTPTAETLAQRFHEAYERLAPSFGYETRTASAKPWAEVPENNRRLMTAVCAEIAVLLNAEPAREQAYNSGFDDGVADYEKELLVARTARARAEQERDALQEIADLPLDGGAPVAEEYGEAAANYYRDRAYTMSRIANRALASATDSLAGAPVPASDRSRFFPPEVAVDSALTPPETPHV